MTLDLSQVNAALAKISSEDQVKLMDDMIQEATSFQLTASDDKQTFFSQVMKILKDNWPTVLTWSWNDPLNLHDWNHRWV